MAEPTPLSIRPIVMAGQSEFLEALKLLPTLDEIFQRFCLPAHLVNSTQGSYARAAQLEGSGPDAE